MAANPTILLFVFRPASGLPATALILGFIVCRLTSDLACGSHKYTWMPQRSLVCDLPKLLAAHYTHSSITSSALIYHSTPLHYHTRISRIFNCQHAGHSHQVNLSEVQVQAPHEAAPQRGCCDRRRQPCDERSSNCSDCSDSAGPGGPGGPGSCAHARAGTGTTSSASGCASSGPSAHGYPGYPVDAHSFVHFHAVIYSSVSDLFFLNSHRQ
jgi:hypothetical protein